MACALGIVAVKLWADSCAAAAADPLINHLTDANRSSKCDIDLNPASLLKVCYTSNRSIGNVFSLTLHFTLEHFNKNSSVTSPQQLF